MCWSVLIVVVALPLISAIIVLHQGWRPSGDVALIGIRVNDILRGRPALIGQPTTGENFGSGIAGSHPGPIEFYFLAPFVGLLGSTAGMALGAATINAASLGGIIWLAVRRGGMVLALVSGAVLALMMRSLEGNLLHDAVSSNVGTLPAMLTMFAAWAIVAGDLRVSPLFVVAGSFALQDHLAYLGTIGPVVGLGIVATVIWVRSYRRAGHWADIVGQVRSATLVGLVLWLPVVLDEVVGDRNLDRTWRTFSGGRTAGSGLEFAIDRLAFAVAPIPVFARRLEPLGYLSTPTALASWASLAVGTCLAVVTVAVVRRRQTALIAGVAVAWTAVSAGLLSATKLPVAAGIQPSNLRWMWTTGAFAWIVLLWTIWQLLPGRGRIQARVPVAVVAGSLVAWSAVGVIATTELHADRDGKIMDHLPAFHDRVMRAVPKGRYVIQYSGPSAAGTVGPALVHRLDEAGYALFVDAGTISRAYGKDRIYLAQPADAILLVSTDGQHPRDEGWSVVARAALDLNQHDQAGGVVRILRKELPR